MHTCKCGGVSTYSGLLLHSPYSAWEDREELRGDKLPGDPRAGATLGAGDLVVGE